MLSICTRTMFYMVLVVFDFIETKYLLNHGKSGGIFYLDFHLITAWDPPFPGNNHGFGRTRTGFFKMALVRP